MSDETKLPVVTAKHVLVALGNIIAELDAIGKDGRNQHQNYNFRGIDQVYNTLHPLFAKHRVLMKPVVLRRVERETKTQKGAEQLHVTEKIKYVFVSCVDGSKFTVGPVWAEGIDTSDKATNKCMSAAQKYALIQTLLIPTKDVVDGDSETIERGTATQPQQREQRPQQQNRNGDPWSKFKETNEANGDEERHHGPPPALAPIGDVVTQVPPDVLAMLPRGSLSAKPFLEQNDVELAATVGLLERCASKAKEPNNRVVLATLAAVAKNQLASRAAS